MSKNASRAGQINKDRPMSGLFKKQVHLGGGGGGRGETWLWLSGSGHVHKLVAQQSEKETSPVQLPNSPTYTQSLTYFTPA